MNFLLTSNCVKIYLRENYICHSYRSSSCISIFYLPGNQLFKDVLAFGLTYILYHVKRMKKAKVVNILFLYTLLIDHTSFSLLSFLSFINVIRQLYAR